MQLDQLDQKAADAFEGYIVRKDLVRTFSRQFPVPTYVVEFLLGRYCATIDESEIKEGLEIVQRQLTSRAVKAGEEELFKAKAYKEGSLKIRCHRLTAMWLEYVGNLRLEDKGGPDYVECYLSIADAELIQSMGEEVFGRWVKK